MADGEIGPGLGEAEAAAGHERLSAGSLRRSPLVLRVASAAVLLAIILTGISSGLLWTTVIIAGLVGVGTVEFYGMSKRVGAPAAPWVLGPLTAILLLRFQLNAISPHIVPAGITAAVVLGLGGFLAARRPRASMNEWGMALAGAMYLGWSLSFYFALYGIHNPDPERTGLAWLVALAGSAVIGDTAALVVGTRFGRRPFFPRISPRKSLEGAIGGFVAQALFFAAFGLLADVPAPHNFILGALLAIGSQAGDLMESQFKRSARVKDASGLIPGHGGMLDRMDSLIPLAAVAYYYMALLLHARLPQ
jgi:phosphatidate cytidylyltransferase